MPSSLQGVNDAPDVCFSPPVRVGVFACWQLLERKQRLSQQAKELLDQVNVNIGLVVPCAVLRIVRSQKHVHRKIFTGPNTAYPRACCCYYLLQ